MQDLIWAFHILIHVHKNNENINIVCYSIKHHESIIITQYFIIQYSCV